MGAPGKAALEAGGKRGLKPCGKAGCFLPDGTCPCCSPCKIETLGEKVLAPNQTWDLTPFQGPGKASPGAYYRIDPIVPCPAVWTNFFGRGCVDQQGELEHLRSSVRNFFSYTITVALQIGCYDAGEDKIHWPGTCHPWTPKFSCT